MDKAFIEKLNYSSPLELRRYKTILIRTGKHNELSVGKRGFYVRYSKVDANRYAYSFGNGYFTSSSSNYADNLGKKLSMPDVNKYVILTPNIDGQEIEIPVKDLVSIGLGTSNTAYDSANTLTEVDITPLVYSNNLKEIHFYYIKTIYGNIEIFKDKLKISHLTLVSSSQVTGDIANLANLTSMTVLQLDGTQVIGDISSLKSMTAMNTLHLNGTQVIGDISSLKSMTQLTSLSLSTTGVTGDISSLKSMTQLTKLSLSATGVTGDISNIVNNLTNLKYLGIPPKVIITDEQKKTLTDRGCTVVIK